VQERAKELLVGRADRPTEQDEQVDVGVEAQMPASVATEREHGDLRRGLRRRVIEQLPDQAVEVVREALEGGAAGVAARGLRRQFLAGRVELGESGR
jgi:hypothetical protein